MSFQATVSQFFEWQTSLVVRWPLPWLIVPPFFSFLLVGLAASDFHLNITNETLQVFLPDDMPSLRDLKQLMKVFPPRDPQRDTYSILGAKFAYFILESTDGNVLNQHGLTALRVLHRHVKGIKSTSGISFDSICARDGDSCLLHPLLLAVDEDPSFASIFFKYPVLRYGDLYLDNALVFGGVEIDKTKIDSDGNAPMLRATAIRAVYPLDDAPNTDEWISHFLSSMSQWKESNDTRVFWATSNSLAKEMERNGELLVPWMPWASLLLIVFCSVSCALRDVVRSQPFLGLSAMINASMATIAATALLIYIRFPFLPLVFIMPFLVVSIGVDNMFLMLRSWRLTKEDNLENRFVEALTETAASLFLTSLTDGLSFAIGAISDFHAVRVFCTYCALAILFMFIFQISFFSATMALCCRREVSGRHWFFINRVVTSPSSSLLKKPLSSSFSFASRPLPPPPSTSFGTQLAGILQHPYIRIVMAVIYCLYLAIAVYFALKLPLGLDMKLLPPDGSFVAAEMAAQERLFKDFGGFCFAVVHLKQGNLGNPATRRRLLELYEFLSSSDYASRGEFWLEEFEKRHKGEVFDQQGLATAVFTFLAKPLTHKFRNDIRFSLNGSIEETKILLRTRNLGPESNQPRVDFLRSTMVSSSFDGFVYDTSFLLVDQQMITVMNVVSNVFIAIMTMLVICVLMVPRSVSALCVALSILSINLGVVGALSAASTRLDIISMITIVMSIGFSVDYVTHTTFHFVSQREDRLERCLHMMLEPMCQAALSTVVGVAPLALVPAYIVRTFVLTVLFVVVIGLLHGLVFLPALLETIVPESEYLQPYSPHKRNNKE